MPKIIIFQFFFELLSSANKDRYQNFEQNVLIKISGNHYEPKTIDVQPHKVPQKLVSRVSVFHEKIQNLKIFQKSKKNFFANSPLYSVD